MFKLLRNRTLMKFIVGFVALTFLGGFVGSYALRSAAPDEQAGGNQVADQVAQTLQELDEEINRLTEVAKNDPEDVDAMIRLGDAWYESARIRAEYFGERPAAQLEEASSWYARALAQDGERINLQLSLALVETSLGDYSQAQSHFESFFDVYPDSFDGNALYVQMLMLSDRTDEARTHLLKTKELASTQEEQNIVSSLEAMLDAS